MVKEGFVNDIIVINCGTGLYNNFTGNIMPEYLLLRSFSTHLVRILRLFSEKL